jgi:hypothetical protein
MSPWPRYPHWRIWSSAGQGWKVIKGTNADKFPVCFFTSYHSCCKEQTVDLEELGLKFSMKNYTVEITLKQWFKFVGPCVMDLSMKLISENQQQSITTRRKYNYKDQKIGIWTEAKLIHTTNISGLKFLKFYHGSTCDLVLEDEEEQKRVGTCMAEASLSISFPRPQLTNKS